MNRNIKATKKYSHTYWDELATESIRISQLTTSENGLISKEATNLPTLEANCYQQLEDIISNIISQPIRILHNITANNLLNSK